MTAPELIKDLAELPPDLEISFVYDNGSKEIYTKIVGVYEGNITYSMKCKSDIVLYSDNDISPDAISGVIILWSYQNDKN